MLKKGTIMNKKLSIIICTLLLSLVISSSNFAKRGGGRGFHGGHGHYKGYRNNGGWHRRHNGRGAAIAIPAIIGTVAATAAAVSEAEAEKKAYEDAYYDDVYVDDDYEVED